jgi:hypothetical protein
VKLRDRIQVPPLDDERLTNIERRLVVGVSELAHQRAPVARRGFGFAAAGLVACAAAALIGWKLHAVPATQVPAPLAQHFAVADGSKISVDGATLGGTASYEVTRDPQRVVVDMKRGSLDLAVVHDPHRTLVIRAADTEIEDVGTHFRVDFDGASAVQVRVTEGEVKVTRHAQVVRVAAGNGWTTDRGLLALAELDPVVVATQEPAPVASAPVAPAPVAPAPIARPASHRAPRVAVAPVVPERAAIPADPYVELRTAIRKVPLDFAPAIDGRADAATEIAKLKKVAYSPTTLGPEASLALYQIAVLLYRPLGQDAEALRTLDMFQRRFHGGKELRAAMWLRVRIECSHSFDESCRRAAYSYQHDFMSGDASDVAVRITNAQ